MDVYVATDSYKPGAAVWLKYTPYLKVKTLPDIPSAAIPNVYCQLKFFYTVNSGDYGMQVG